MSCSHYRNKQSGFTLIELMVVVVIAAILLAIAVPSFQNLIKRNNVDALQSRLASALSTARTEAASRNKVMTICASDDAAACTGDDWSDGWIIFEDNNGDGTVDTGTDGNDVIIDVHENDTAYKVKSGAEAISFNSQGFVTSGSQALLTVCEPDNDATYARGLFVNASGLVMKTRDTDDDGIHNDPTTAGNTGELTCP